VLVRQGRWSDESASSGSHPVIFAFARLLLSVASNALVPLVGSPELFTDKFAVSMALSRYFVGLVVIWREQRRLGVEVPCDNYRYALMLHAEHAKFFPIPLSA
jgi:hypothetical protein